MRYRFIHALSLLFLLSACQPGARFLDQDFSHIDWQQRENALSVLDTWQLEGRVALQSDEGSWSAGLQWKQRSNGYEIYLRGPLGGTVLAIYHNAGQILLVNDGREFSADNAEQLIYQQTGWRIPVEGLRYWVMAMRHPQYPASEKFRYKLLSRLEQSGWQIEYLEYQNISGYPLPRKMEMHHHHLKVRLVLQKWQLPRLAAIARTQQVGDAACSRK